MKTGDVLFETLIGDHAVEVRRVRRPENFFEARCRNCLLWATASAPAERSVVRFWDRFSMRLCSGTPIKGVRTHTRDGLSASETSKTCSLCRGPLKANRKDARYCSPKCRRDAYRARLAETLAQRPTRLVCTNEAARILGVSRWTVRKLVERGDLVGLIVEGDIRRRVFTYDELDALRKETKK